MTTASAQIDDELIPTPSTTPLPGFAELHEAITRLVDVASRATQPRVPHFAFTINNDKRRSAADGVRRDRRKLNNEVRDDVVTL